MIFAGAGTGKTRVITHRIAHLIADRKVPAGKVVAVTFTNKAAREMRGRVAPLLKDKKASRGLTVTTFHSLCLRILRADGEHIGLGEQFTIFGDADQKGLVRSILTDTSTDATADEVLTAISLAKNRLQTPSDYPENNSHDTLVKGVYAQYQNLLASMNAVDFDDLLLSTIRLFRAHGHVKVGWQRRFDHILVDEFQDTNAAQYELLKLLWDGTGSMAVVGDDDQAIYGWRGAEIGMFSRFAEEFSGCHEVTLTQNYRSTGRILEAAGHIIEKVEDRHPKRLWSELGEGKKIGIINGKDAEDEARQVVEHLNLVHFAQKQDLSGFAILIRTNMQSRAFEAALREAHLPYVVVGATGFFDRAEIRDITAYLRLLVNDADEVALRRVINTPRRGIGAMTLVACARYAKAGEMTLYTALDHAGDIPEVPKAARHSIQAFIDLMAEIKFDFTHGDMESALRRLIADTDLATHWKDSADNDRIAQFRVDSAEEVVRMLSRYIKRETEPTLSGFLEHLSLLDRLDDEEEVKGKVTIITLHAAKGLEFDHVYFAGMEEGFLPHTRSVEEGRELAEERRLTYVGITRAKKRLTLCWADSRNRYGETVKRLPSRFLDDIPKHLLAIEEEEVPAAQQEEMAAGFFDSMKNMLD